MEDMKEKLARIKESLARLEKDLWGAYALLPELIQRVNEAQLDVERVILESEHKC